MINPLQHDCSLLFFSNMMKHSADVLMKQREFLLAAAKNPRLLFEDHHMNMDVHSVAAKLINSMHDGDKIRIHDFQTYVASLVNQYLQEWLREKNIRGHLIHAAVRNPNTYPSIMAIYCDGAEVIQFNIHERYYGVQHEPKDENDIRADYESVEAQLNESVERQREHIKKYEQILSEPFSIIYGHYHKHGKKREWKSYFTELYEYTYVVWAYKLWPRKAEKLKAEVQKKIKNLETGIINLQKRPPGWLTLDERLEKNRQRKAQMEMLIPLFESFGFSRTWDKHKLY